MLKVAVCGWSYRMGAKHIAAEMEKIGVDAVHFAACPFVDPKAIVPGTCGETENIDGTGGVESLEEQREFIAEQIASGKWKIVSTLFNSRYDDYSTIASIRATGGLMPDEHWEENRGIIAKAAKQTAEWKCPYMLLHAGFMEHDNAVQMRKLKDRLECARDLCGEAGVGLTLETGQEQAEHLAELLTDLPGIGVNFDPANMILYGTGDPIAAIKVLAPWIKNIHIKDGIYPKNIGEWGSEPAWGEGQVNADLFMSTLMDLKWSGYLAVEREAGNDRSGEIAKAVKYLRAKGVK